MLVARRFLGDASLLSAGLTGCVAAGVIAVVTYIALLGWPLGALMDSGSGQPIGLQTGAQGHGASPATAASEGSPQAAAPAGTTAGTLQRGHRTALSHHSTSRRAGATAGAGSGGGAGHRSGRTPVSPAPSGTSGQASTAAETATPPTVDSSPPGQAKKASEGKSVPPGQAKKSEGPANNAAAPSSLPPGQAKKGGSAKAVPAGQAKKGGSAKAVPPGQAKKSAAH